MTDQYPDLTRFLKRISTGPLSLRDALIAGIAYASGVVPIMDLRHITTLQEHCEGWFGLRDNVEALLVDIAKRQEM